MIKKNPKSEILPYFLKLNKIVKPA
ncbi:hypothetical protein AYI68_g8048, partial [Smittium mucronatum]